MLSVVVLFGVNSFIYFDAVSGINKKKAEAEEQARPASVEVTLLLDKSCSSCSDLSGALEFIKQRNVSITSEQILDWQETQAQELIQKYGIKRIPTLLIGGELDKDKQLKQVMDKTGSIVDGTFVMTNVLPPYVDISTGAVRGEFEIVYLEDSNCDECYDVGVHQKVLANLGLSSGKEKTLRVSDPEGRAMIRQYNITLVPTIVLRGDMEVYPALQQVWQRVGTVEADGSYVFRDGVKLMGTYKNLNSGKVITP